MGSIKGVSRGSYTRRLHQAEKLECEKCGKSYKRKTILLHHIRTKHLNYHTVCPICSKRCSSVSVGNRHLKKVHNVANSRIKLKLQPNQSKFPSAGTLRNPSFEADKAFPCMTNKISVKENNKFGKHLVAKSNIEVGQTVMSATAFAAIEYISSVNSSCFHCGKVKNSSFIRCPHCIDVYFCSEQCSFNTFHRAKCNIKFNHDDNEVVRLVIEIITVAYRAIQNVDTFVDFCSGILFFNKKSKNLRAPYSHYAEMLQLNGNVKDEHSAIARRVVKLITMLPSFKSFKTQELQRLLFNLAYQHATTIRINAFSEDFEVSKGGVLTSFYIFDVLSRFNHSCEPNIRHMLDGDYSISCIATNPIKSGDQLFINYVDGKDFENEQERKEYIMELWNFTCKCQRCVKLNE